MDRCLFNNYGFDDRLTDMDWDPGGAFWEDKRLQFCKCEKREETFHFLSQVMVSVLKWLDGSGNQTYKP